MCASRAERRLLCRAPMGPGRPRGWCRTQPEEMGPISRRPAGRDDVTARRRIGRWTNRASAASLVGVTWMQALPGPEQRSRRVPPSRTPTNTAWETGPCQDQCYSRRRRREREPRGPPPCSLLHLRPGAEAFAIVRIRSDASAPPVIPGPPEALVCGVTCGGCCGRSARTDRAARQISERL